MLFVVSAAFLTSPKTQTAAQAVPFSTIRKIIDTRCLGCHADKPSFQGFAEAPKGVKLDTPERIRALALQVHRQAVLSKAMPPGNLTGLTEEERQLLDRWYRAGAKLD